MLNLTIEKILPGVSSEQIQRFVKATDFKSKGLPLTLATMFREPEFDWLMKLDIDMRQLLHTEQEYEYLSLEPLSSDDLTVTSKVVQDKTRANLRFMTIESLLSQNQKMRIKSRTTFVIKQPSPKEGGL